MSIQREVSVIAIRVFLLSYLLAVPASAQTYTLSGKVSDLAGHAVPTATVTAKSVQTGHSFTAVTNSDGMYSIRDLAGGDYRVSAVAGELQAPPIKVTLAAAQTTDLTVSPTPRASANPDQRATLFQRISSSIGTSLSFSAI
jgi:Carboxypeptidase regulatory-like domain